MEKNKTILIIEDDVNVSNVIEDILIDNEYRVLGPAKNKKMCNELFKKFDNEISLILLDIHLMNGSDGINCLLENYKKGYCKDVPVLFVSGNNDQKNLKRISQIKNNVGFVVKPFHAEELLTHIRMAFINFENDKKIGHETHLSLLLAQILNDHQTNQVSFESSLDRSQDRSQDNSHENSQDNSKESNLHAMLIKFGNLLRRKRKDLNQTQAVAADLLKINYRHYQDVESGKVNLRMETFLKILNYLA